MFSTPYDYDSIMHYSPWAFAKDRMKPTLIPLHPAKNMGQREGKMLFRNRFAISWTSIIITVSTAMSDGDVIRLNRMYECGQEQSTVDSLPAETTSNPREAASGNKKSTIWGMFIFKIIPKN